MMELTELLRKVRLGDADALGTLIPLVYQELKVLAASNLRRERDGIPLQTTDLVHEAFLKLAAMAHPNYENRTHFYGIASHLMREVLVDLARARLAKKRGPDREVALASIDGFGAVETDERLLLLHETIDRLEKEHPRKASLIEMRYFGGMTAEDSASLVDLPVHTVRREIRFAEAWIKREMGK